MAAANDEMEHILDVLSNKGSKSAMEDMTMALRSMEDSMQWTGQGELNPARPIVTKLFPNPSNCVVDSMGSTTAHGTQASTNQAAKLGSTVETELQTEQNLYFAHLYVTIPDLGPYIAAGKTLRIPAGWVFGLITAITVTYPKAGNKSFPIAGGASLINYLLSVFEDHAVNAYTLYKSAGQELSFTGGVSGVYTDAERTAIIPVPAPPFYSGPVERYPLNIADLQGNNIKYNFSLAPFDQFCIGTALASKSYIESDAHTLQTFSLNYTTIDLDEASLTRTSPKQDYISKIMSLASYASAQTLEKSGLRVFAYPCDTNVECTCSTKLIKADAANGGVAKSFTVTFELTDVGDCTNWKFYLMDPRDLPEYNDLSDFRGETWATVPTMNVKAFLSKTPLHESNNTVFENLEQVERYPFNVLVATNPAEWGVLGWIGSTAGQRYLERQVTNIQWSTMPCAGSANIYGIRNFDTKTISVTFTLADQVALELTRGVVPMMTAISRVNVFTDGIHAVGIEMKAAD